MQLTQRNIGAYLLEHQLIDGAEFLRGRYRWRQLSGRYNHFVVFHTKGEGLFVRQLKAKDLASRDSLQREAAAYYLLKNADAYRMARPGVTDYLGYDSRHQVLFTGYFQSLGTMLELTEMQAQLSADQARNMTRTLTPFHQEVNSALLQKAPFQRLGRRMPWIFQLPTQSHATDAVLQLIQQDQALIDGLDEAARSWSPTSLIHGDVRLSNFLVQLDGRKEKLKLIDWELATLGDPLWDLAGLLCTYLAASLAYVNDASAPDDLPLAKTFWNQNAVYDIWKAIWQTYAEARHWSYSENEAAARKVVAFIGACLLQSAVEYNRVSPKQLSQPALAMLNQARYCFEKPGQFVRYFFSQPPQFAVHE